MNLLLGIGNAKSRSALVCRPVKMLVRIYREEYYTNI